MTRSVVLLGVFISMLTVVTAHASEVGPLPQFTEGTAASAEAVNNNFNSLQFGVDDNHQRISDLESAPNSDTLNNLNCNDGELARWNGTATQWECAVPYAGGVIYLPEQYTINSTTPSTFYSFTVQVPAAGKLIITFLGNYFINVDSPVSNSLRASARFWICDTANSSASCGDSRKQYTYVDPDNASDLNDLYDISMVREVTVTGAGPRTFYINGSAVDSYAIINPTAYPLTIFDKPAVKVSYFPKSLTITTPSP